VLINQQFEFGTLQIGKKNLFSKPTLSQLHKWHGPTMINIFSQFLVIAVSVFQKSYEKVTATNKNDKEKFVSSQNLNNHSFLF
jgi:polyhydroxyalkanoate synthesis regulator protein